MFVLIAHWLACVWYTIGDHEFADDVQFGWLTTLLYDTSAADHPPIPDPSDHPRRLDADTTAATIPRPSAEMSYLTAVRRPVRRIAAM